MVSEGYLLVLWWSVTRGVTVFGNGTRPTTLVQKKGLTLLGGHYTKNNDSSSSSSSVYCPTSTV